MSSRKMNLRLACTIVWVLVVATNLGRNHVLATERLEDPLDTATLLPVNETIFISGPSTSLDHFEVEVPSPGILSLYVSAPNARSASSLPRIFGLESMHDTASVPDQGIGFNKVRQLPQEVILHSLRPQVLRFTVGPEKPEQALEELKLQIDFAPETTSPNEVYTLDKNPPESCEVISAPVLGEGPFSNQFLLVDRPVDWTRDIEPEDCDIVDGNLANPGVLMIQALGSPMEASLFTSRSCSSDHRSAEGLLGSRDSALITPLHPGFHRLVLEPLDRNPVSYSLEVRHFDLCRNGIRDDHGDRPLCASEVEPGRTLHGEIRDTRGPDEDFFTLLLARQTAVGLQVSGRVDLEVLDDRGQRLLYSPGESSEAGRRLVKTLGPGRFYVGLSGTRGALVEYSLTTRLGVDP